MNNVTKSLLGLCVLSGLGCSTTNRAVSASEPAPRPRQCPKEVVAPTLLPGVSLEHRQLSYWTELLAKTHDLDEVLLNAEGIAVLNASYQIPRPAFFPQSDLQAELDPAKFRIKMEERLVWMEQKISKNEYRRESGPVDFQVPATLEFTPSYRVALQELQIYCAPTALGFYDSDSTSKRTNRNACSSAHPQELVQIVMPWGDMQLARTATSWGFISSNAPLSPVLDAQATNTFAVGPFGRLSRELRIEQESGTWTVPEHTRIPYVDSNKKSAFIATKEGLLTSPLENIQHTPNSRPLTRRALLAEVLSYLGTPYGFGGSGGGIDCSRLMLDVLGSFGVSLPRFSGWQSKAGTFSLEVADTSDKDKQSLIDAASASGIVILHLPGHIMLYLGRDHKDEPMAIHALSYYLDPCDAETSTTIVVGQVQVGSLELGRGTWKTALIERINRITVIGKGPSAELSGRATRMPLAPEGPGENLINSSVP